MQIMRNFQMGAKTSVNRLLNTLSQEREDAKNFHLKPIKNNLDITKVSEFIRSTLDKRKSGNSRNLNRINNYMTLDDT